MLLTLYAAQSSPRPLIKQYSIRGCQMSSFPSSDADAGNAAATTTMFETADSDQQGCSYLADAPQTQCMLMCIHNESPGAHLAST